MTENTLRDFLIQLNKNLNILREREAKYATAAPLDLLNQIDDYEQAIALSEKALNRGVVLEELQAEFNSLNLQIDTVVFVAQEPPRKSFTGQNPYRGLKKFTENEAKFFFGRNAAIENLLKLIQNLLQTETNLQKPSLIAVLGPSGSGKSSLVRAGLIPALHRGRIDGSETWPIKVMLPGPRPLDALAAQFVDTGRGLPALRGDLDRDRSALQLLITESLTSFSEDAHFVLVIDQFEEIFTLCRDEVERQAFLDQLLYTASLSRGRGIIILTMRADFYSKVAAYPYLAQIITANQLLVSPMSEKELREAILLPAEAVGLELEKALIEILIGDTYGASGALPLLQHALFELFEHRDGNLLTLEAYREIGGVQGALAQRADSVVDRLDPEQQQIAQRIFMRLIQPGEGTEDTRRRVQKAELLPVEVQTESVEEILQMLADARLVTTTRDVASGEEMVDVAHEALVQGWSQLRRWLDENRAGLRTHRHLTEAAEEWKRNERDESYLYRGVRLAEAEEWAETQADNLNTLEREFLDTSLATAEAIERAKVVTRRRRTLLILGAGWLAVLVACVMTGLAALSIRFAFNAQVKAVTDGAERILESNPELAVLRSLAVQSVTDSAEATSIIAQAPVGYPAIATTLTGHDNRVEKVAFSPDGTYLASLSYDSRCIFCDEPESPQIIIRDTKDNQPVTILTGPEIIRDFAFSPDGKQVMTSGNKEITLWDVATGQPVMTRSVDGLVLSLTFHPDGKHLIYETPNQAVVWEINSDQVSNIYARMESNTAIELSSDGKYLAIPVNYWDNTTKTITNTIKIWDMTKDQFTTELEHVDDIASIAFSPDGTQLAVSESDGTIIIWDVATSRSVKMVTESQGYGSIAWSPNGKYIVNGATVWDVATVQPVTKLREAASGSVTFVVAPGQPVRLGRASGSLAFSPDGMVLASGWDQTVKLWDMAQVESLTTLKQLQIGIKDVVFDSTGRRLASGLRDGSIILWDIATGQPELTLTGHIDAINAIAFSPDGKWLASGSQDSTIKIWEVDTGHLEQSLDRHNGPVGSIAFSPDSTKLASASDKLLIWDLDTGQLETTLAEGGISAIAFSPDGKLIASADISEHKITIWNVDNGQPATTIDGEGFVGDVYSGITDMIFSPDGESLLWTTYGGIQIWDVAKNEKSKAFIGRQSFFYALAASSQVGIPIGDRFDEWPVTTEIVDTPGFQNLALSPNGSVLAGNTYSLILFWDMNSGQLMSTIAPDVGGISGVAFSPDGTRLAVGGSDGQIHILDTLFIAHPCQWVTRNLSREEWRELWSPFPVFYREVCPGLPVPGE